MNFNYNFCFCKKDLLIDIRSMNSVTTSLEDAIEEARTLPVSLNVFPTVMKLKTDNRREMVYPINPSDKNTTQNFTLKRIKESSWKKLEELFMIEDIFHMIDAGKLESLISAAPYLADSDDYEEIFWSADELYLYLNGDPTSNTETTVEPGIDFRCYSYKVSEIVRAKG